MGVRRRAAVLVLNSIVVLAACSSGGADTAAGGGDPTASSPVAAPDAETPVVGGSGVPAPTLPGASGATGPTLPSGTVPSASAPIASTPLAGGAPSGAPAGAPGGAPAPPGVDADELTGKALEEYLARRYEAYWDAFDAARTHPTASPAADFPELAELADGTQLDTSHQSIADLAAAGEATKEPAEPAIGGTDAATEHRVRVDRVDGAAAELTACVVNDDVRYAVGSGQVVDAGVRTVRSTATMARGEGGQWKLIRSQAVSIDDGVTGCWAGADYPY